MAMPDGEHECGVAVDGVKDTELAEEQLSKFARRVAILFSEGPAASQRRQPAELLFQAMTPANNLETSRIIILRTRKMIAVGKGGQREVPDFQLSRFACYLIAQNGDPRKPEIALAQKYFAIQTRRQELSDQQAADLERLELRKQASEEFKMLSGAARQAGVQSQHFGIFHDAGYKGLYGGRGSEAIRLRKRIPAKDNLMDRMDATELAANQFRMTQTREKLARDGVRGEQRAIQTHNDVGQEVRAAIQRIGGTLPENIPPAEHIQQVEQRVQCTSPKLVLDDSDARGLSQVPSDSSTTTKPDIPPV